jgi:anti-anti-sigma regulatory factor
VYDLHDIVLQLGGVLGEADAPEFEKCADVAIAESPRRLVIELSALERMEPSAVWSVAAVRDRAEHAGVEFILDSPSARVSVALVKEGIRDSFFVR